MVTFNSNVKRFSYIMSVDPIEASSFRWYCFQWMLVCVTRFLLYNSVHNFPPLLPQTHGFPQCAQNIATGSTFPVDLYTRERTWFLSLLSSYSYAAPSSVASSYETGVCIWWSESCTDGKKTRRLNKPARHWSPCSLQMSQSQECRTSTSWTYHHRLQRSLSHGPVRAVNLTRDDKFPPFCVHFSFFIIYIYQNK